MLPDAATIIGNSYMSLDCNTFHSTLSTGGCGGMTNVAAGAILIDSNQMF